MNGGSFVITPDNYRLFHGTVGFPHPFSQKHSMTHVQPLRGAATILFNGSSDSLNIYGLRHVPVHSSAESFRHEHSGEDKRVTLKKRPCYISDLLWIYTVQRVSTEKRPLGHSGPVETAVLQVRLTKTEKYTEMCILCVKCEIILIWFASCKCFISSRETPGHWRHGHCDGISSRRRSHHTVQPSDRVHAGK